MINNLQSLQNPINVFKYIKLNKFVNDSYEKFNSYDQVYNKGRTILGQRGVTPPDAFIDVTKNRARYAGHTDLEETVFPEDGPPYTYSTTPLYMKKTLDWKATRAPLRRTASVRRRTTR